MLLYSITVSTIDSSFDADTYRPSSAAAHPHEQHLHQHQQLQQQHMFPGQNFIDPAIMSMSMGSGYREAGFPNGGQLPLQSPNGLGQMGVSVPPPGLGNLDNLPQFVRRQSNNMPLASPTTTSNGMSSSLLRGGYGTDTKFFSSQGRYYPF